MSLSGKQRRYLRALGHAMNPVVQIGRAGMSDEVVQAIAAALDQHELIKIKLASGSDHHREELAERAASATGAEVAQVLGNTVLLYRPHPEKPVIALPPAEPRPGRSADS